MVFWQYFESSLLKSHTQSIWILCAILKTLYATLFKDSTVEILTMKAGVILKNPTKSALWEAKNMAPFYCIQWEIGTREHWPMTNQAEGNFEEGFSEHHQYHVGSSFKEANKKYITK
jgi:hypothetical protein